MVLIDLLELLEKRTSKRASDFAVMDQVLRCLRSLMNLERGMRVILGLDEMMDAAESMSLDDKELEEAAKQAQAMMAENGGQG